MPRLFRFSIPLLTIMMAFTGCTTTFMGSLFVFTFRDMVLYVVLAFAMAVLISFKSSWNGKKAFWIGFILSLLLTPLAGFIYLLILFTQKSD